MAIDPSIALGVKPMQLDSPLNSMGQMMNLRNASQENQLRQFQMQQAQQDAQRNEMLRQSLSGIDTSTSEGQDAYGRELLRSGNVEQAQKFTTGRAMQDKEQRAADSAKIKLASDQTELGIKLLSAAVDQPTYDAARARMQQNGLDISKMPPAFSAEYRDSELRQGVDTKTLLERRMADLGGMVQPIDFAGRAAGTPLYKTQSPDSKATNARLANAGITAQSHPFLSQAILDGRVPLTRVNSRTAALFESVLQNDPQADLNAINIDQIGAGAGARTAGTTQANISIASDEARRMIGVARTIISKVNPSEYPSLNAVQNAISKGTGGVEIVQLNTALNSLINSYARAINPRGTPTVSDKTHAREIVNSAMSKGQLEGTLAVMEQEMDAALAAANEGRARGTPKEGATATPATPATGGGDLMAAARAELARRRGAQK
jgi:hypothetical protein